MLERFSITKLNSCSSEAQCATRVAKFRFFMVFWNAAQSVTILKEIYVREISFKLLLLPGTPARNLTIFFQPR